MLKLFGTARNYALAGLAALTMGGALAVSAAPAEAHWRGYGYRPAYHAYPYRWHRPYVRKVVFVGAPYHRPYYRPYFHRPVVYRPYYRPYYRPVVYRPFYRPWAGHYHRPHFAHRPFARVGYWR